MADQPQLTFGGFAVQICLNLQLLLRSIGKPSKFNTRGESATPKARASSRRALRQACRTRVAQALAGGRLREPEDKGTIRKLSHNQKETRRRCVQCAKRTDHAGARTQDLLIYDES